MAPKRKNGGIISKCNTDAYCVVSFSSIDLTSILFFLVGEIAKSRRRSLSSCICSSNERKAAWASETQKTTSPVWRSSRKKLRRCNAHATKENAPKASASDQLLLLFPPSFLPPLSLSHFSSFFLLLTPHVFNYFTHVIVPTRVPRLCYCVFSSLSLSPSSI